MFSAVLLDMDGVVMNSMDYHILAWQEIYRSLGKDISRQLILENEGTYDIKLWYNTLNDDQLGDNPTPQEMQKAFAFLHEQGQKQRATLLAKYLDKIKPYPEALPFVKALARRGMPCAMVTSSSRLTVEAIVPPELRSCLQTIVSAEDVARHKPDPEPYLEAARRLSVAAGDCLVIENSPGGLEAGLATGATCMAIISTLDASYLHKAQATFPNLYELGKSLGWM